MTEKKNIFLESHNLKNLHTGFGQFNYWLIKHLTDKNHKFNFTVNAKDATAIQDFKNVRLQKYSSLSRYKAFRIRKKYDLWHSLNQNTRVEPYHEMPYLMTVHDVIFMEQKQKKPVAKEQLEQFKRKIERSNAIVFISEYVKSSVNSFFEIPTDIHQSVIYNGNPVIPQKEIPAINSPSVITKPFLFSIGQFMSKKNFHSLVKMLCYIKDFQLVIAGNSSRPYGELVKKEIKKYKLEDRVFLVGRITEKEKHYYLQHCKAFLFPSLFEGFGLPPIEAMAYGKPVFLAKQTSLPEIGGKYAFYWDEFEPEEMAAVFEQGMNTYENKKKLYQEQLKIRASFFNWKKTANEYLQIYQTLI